MRTMARHAARGAAGTALRVPSGFGGGPYTLCVQPSAPRPRTPVHGRRSGAPFLRVDAERMRTAQPAPLVEDPQPKRLILKHAGARRTLFGSPPS